MKSAGVVVERQRVQGKVGIVASLFNQEYVDALVDSARQRLGGVEVIVDRVPGSFEIPLAVKKIIQKESLDVVMAFGLIWEGETAHADLIGQSVTQALMKISLDYEVPVIHQVLVVKDEAQARERCFGDELNRGKEAAEAALYLLDKISKGL